MGITLLLDCLRGTGRSQGQRTRTLRALGLCLALAACTSNESTPGDDSEDDQNTDESKAGEESNTGNMMPPKPAIDAGMSKPPPSTPPVKKPEADAGGKPLTPGDASIDASVPVSDAGVLPDCKGGDRGPCGTFTTTGGTKIQLGKYGSAMETNVGAEHKNMINPSDTNAGCSLFAMLFGQDPAETAKLLDISMTDLSLYTIYRPANMVDGEKYPIVTWGNGTCAQPEGYGALLRYVASHGFFVVAANSRYSATDNAMVHGIDFAFALNEDEKSPYYQRLDTTKVAAMGHSQGGGATVTTARDSRVKTVILFNGGSRPVKPYLTISGDRDTGSRTAMSMATEINSQAKAAYLFYHMIPGTGAADGHLTLMTQPERVTEPTVAWLKYLLSEDAESKTYFVGADCKLCNKREQFEFGQKGL